MTDPTWIAKNLPTFLEWRTEMVLDKITMSPLNPDQYIREETDKNMIFIHHTAGNEDPYGVIRWWNETPERVGTAFIIGGVPRRTTANWSDGEIIQAFNSKYWAYHLGLKQSNMPPGSISSKDLNSKSIAIELCNWGFLTKKGSRYYSYANAEVPKDQVIEVNYRGYKYWQSYTDAQLVSLKQLLQYLCEKYHIPKEFKGKSMFDINMKAFEGEHGIWTHTSVRTDKTDCYPHPQLIETLESL